MLVCYMHKNYMTCVYTCQSINMFTHAEFCVNIYRSEAKNCATTQWRQIRGIIMSYKGNTDARRRAAQKYHAEKIETIAVRVPIGRKDYYKTAADCAGQSLNQFAITAMDEKINRDGLLSDSVG